jgi:site-specific recombinase XerC
VRGEAASDHVFIYRHRPLSLRYCASRLHTYGRRCGVRMTPHQLRHACATLLLNAGASILTMQAMLGHRHVDTTLDYARLYDGTIAPHYYGAIEEIEGRLGSVENARAPPTNGGQLSALVDGLCAGTLEFGW